MSGRVLTCKQMTELVTDYCEGRLSFGRRLRFQLHLGMCSHCRAYLRQVRATIRATGLVPRIELPAPVEDELLKRFRSWKP